MKSWHPDSNKINSNSMCEIGPRWPYVGPNLAEVYFFFKYLNKRLKQCYDLNVKIFECQICPLNWKFLVSLEWGGQDFMKNDHFASKNNVTVFLWHGCYGKELDISRKTFNWDTFVFRTMELGIQLYYICQLFLHSMIFFNIILTNQRALMSQ